MTERASARPHRLDTAAEPMQLYFRSNGEGPPLLLLHGLLGSSDNWRTVAHRLGGSFTVYSLDLRNHGRSPHDPVMTYEEMAGDLFEFLEARSLRSASVLGHSMGGKVAMQFVTEHPERVAKLVIVDIAPGAYPPTHRRLLDALNALDLRAYRSLADVEAALSRDVADRRTRQFVLKNLGRTPDGAFNWKIGLKEIIANYDRLTGPIQPRHRVDKPICFIRGERSEFIRDADFAAIHSIFPGASVITIPGAGHWVHVDAFEPFISAVLRCLGRT